VCASTEQSRPDSSPASTRPIEFLTENGFSILRLWEIDRTPPPLNGAYRFLVRNPQKSEREITVAITDELVMQATMHSRGRILLYSSFWIFCAERHLAIYLWENDDYPPEDRLNMNLLDPDDCDLALRWETT
jgi:hypothetical protein